MLEYKNNGLTSPDSSISRADKPNENDRVTDIMEKEIIAVNNALNTDCAIEIRRLLWRELCFLMKWHHSHLQCK